MAEKENQPPSCGGSGLGLFVCIIVVDFTIVFVLLSQDKHQGNLLSQQQILWITMICPIVLALCHANPPSSLSMLSQHLSGTVCHWTGPVNQSDTHAFPHVDFDKGVFFGQSLPGIPRNILFRSTRIGRGWTFSQAAHHQWVSSTQSFRQCTLQ